MRHPALILCLALALGGCSILKRDEAPVCDGKDRRPANPNGSVLEGTTASATPPRLDQLSAAPSLFASCT